MPDFDVDMDFDYRQDIIQHTRDLYGDPQVGHIVTFGTLKPKNCIADVGRTLGIPLSEVNMLKSKVSENLKAKLKNCFEEANEKFPDGGQLAPFRHDPRYEKLFDLALKLEGCKRNTGLHASGMVIGLTALPDWAPVFKDSKTGEVGVQYTMDIIEPCGLVKFDYLGLKTLSLIRYAENIINKHKKEGEEKFICANVSETDKPTFDLFKKGDSVAVFQFESPGMQKILRQFQPEKLEDLVALNALYRPGPMQFIPNYIDGKFKPETIHYPDPCLEPILKETYGVMVYQEQIMQVSQKIAGFSLGGADMLRRAMGKKKPEVMMGKKVEFEEGAIKQGFTKEHADEIFDIMVPFAGYGFNKSHAAAYSVLAYRTGYLKANHPAEFMAANLTNEITSTDGLPVYIAEARRMGIAVDPPDVNRSDDIFDVVDGHIVFGFRGIKGMGTSAAQAIVKERTENGKFKNFIDFLERMITVKEDVFDEESGQKKGEKLAINKKAVEVLIKCGGFDNLGQNRPTLIANLDKAWAYVEKKLSGGDDGQISLFENTGVKEFSDFVFEDVADCTKMEKLNMEKELIGCYVSGHPLDEYAKAYEKATLNSLNIQRESKNAKSQYASDIANGGRSWQMKNSGKEYVAIGMLTELRSIITKKQTAMAFAKLQDYNGTIDLTFFPKTWEQLQGKIENDTVYAFRGKLDTSPDREEPSFIVDSIEDPQVLQNRAIQEVHIQLEDGFHEEQQIFNLKEFLFGNSGTCSVYFHMNAGENSYTIKANTQLSAPNTKDFLESLKAQPFVREVWAE